jgi:DNA polymerase-3 subunit gamma/tau
VAHQSLYRRYRPRRFGEVRGQEHVVRALQNAVRTGTEGHAYLFSGPRGTGKTSTARILAKALNCENLQDGEPCCECSACVEIESGRSFDLFELDAASNNGVDNIRDLVERAAVGSPGRNKVYILDEVHMLTPAASNALLKTLEEPPEHVTFVLATTDPQKVLPTIRSRTQHYEFQLLSAKELSDYVRWIAEDAPLEIDEASIDYVVRQGRGSARDTLSALDQVVAAGGVITRVAPVDRLLQALADHDSGAAVLAVSDALALGHDPRVLAESLLSELRDAFLLSLGVEVPHLVDADGERLGDWATTLGTPTLTRAMEAVGAATVDMRQAADPRVPLEVALVRLCSTPTGAAAAPAAPGGDDGVVAELLRRIESLEKALADGSGPPGAGAPSRTRAAAAPTPSRPRAEPAPAPPDDAPAVAPAADEGDAGDGPARARAALGALRSRKAEAAGAAPTERSAPRPPAPKAPAAPKPGSPASAPAAAPAPAPAPTDPEPAPVADAPAAASAPAPAAPTAPAPTASGPDRDALALAFGDVIMPSLKGMAKAIYSRGRFVSVSDQGAVFALDNAPTRDRAERFRPEVEAALTSHFGAPVHLVLVDSLDPDAVPAAPSAARAAAPSAPPPSEPPVDEPSPAEPRAVAERPAAPTPAAPGTTPPSEPASRTAPADPGPGAAAQAAPPAAAGDDTADDDESAIIDVHELEDADVAATGVEKLTKAFPGAVLVDGPDGTA